MLRDKREYRAILICASPRPLDARRMFERCDIEIDSVVANETGTFRYQHCVLYSKEAFFGPSVVMENDLKMKRRGKPVYRYNFYLGSVAGGSGNKILLATPFAAMGAFLCDKIRASQKRTPRYLRVDLNALVASVSRGKNDAGRLRLTGVQYFVPGDPKAQSVTIGGDNVLRSEMYEAMKKRLRQLKASSRRCEVTCEADVTNRVRLGIDRYGNFSFRVMSQACNFPLLGEVFEYLGDQDLLTQTIASPFNRETEAL